MEQGISTIRKSTVLFDEDNSITLMKPFSGEHQGKLIVIHENAYGDFYSMLTPINEIKKKLNISDEEFREILDKL